MKGVVDSLHYCADEDPKRFKPLIANSTSWPVNWPAENAALKRLQKWLHDDMGLASRAWVHVSGRRRQKDTTNVPVNEFVIRYLGELHRMRRWYDVAKIAHGRSQQVNKSCQLPEADLEFPDQSLERLALELPEFSSDCAKQWGEVVWKLIMSGTNNKPERNSDIARIFVNRISEAKDCHDARSRIKARIMREVQNFAPTNRPE